MPESTLHLSQLLDVASGLTDEADAAIAIAEALLVRSRELQTPQERRQQAELDRMISLPGDRATLVAMTDQAFRTHSSARVADQLTHLLDLQGIPRFFSPIEQTMLRGFQTFGGYLPGVAVPLVKDKMRHETANVILPAEEEPLRRHLAARQETGLRMNLNFLGEALLGERDAQRRLKHYLHALQIPEIACISVKLSTIFSQVSTIARSETVAVVADRMELLYRAAARETFTNTAGTESSKFVYLDMEEYRDLHLTANVFREALSRPGLEQVRAGIALQAYIPDSLSVLDQLIEWSADRVANGGHPITIRLVKGANMEMERVEGSLGGWPQTPFIRKLDTDANYKIMLRRMIDAAAKGHLYFGVASHNLFDIALAILWGSRTSLETVDPQSESEFENGVLSRMQFEMLEGMANHQRRALFESTPTMLLYAPACRQDDFLNAIGYLIRRLDENTGEENFLRHSFRLSPDSETWQRLAEGFRQSLDHIEHLDSSPRRKQDRNLPACQPAAAERWQSYCNEPDTDWALPQNSNWAKSILANWIERFDDQAEFIPLMVAGQVREPDGNRSLETSIDPSRPDHVVCRFTQANQGDIEDAIECAHQDAGGWRELSWDQRYTFFRDAAQNMRQRRGDLIGAMICEGGKTIAEADSEVSEAIDFTEFYPLTAKDYFQRDAKEWIQIRPRGTVAVISPWNFPLAIPCGGLVAALAAGNTVILKPASDTVLPSYKLAQCFWDAGVPKTALQLIPCRGSGVGKQLVIDERIDAVVLTGGTETAKEMLRLRPGLNLIAETGGKNATIVTALCDRDLAIKHVLHSAFSHSGQKCSATSLLLLDQELYDDNAFRDALADAAESLPVGSAWDLTSRIGPLIRPPSGVLERGIKELEPGEEWLVMPKRMQSNPHLYSPGIKWDVQPDSFTHRTELFGPVLGVMPFRKLEQAILIVGATGYGLTSGLESLDDREQQLWRDSIHAGNLYINRSTTGAIVLRQPFGGMGKSAYGPGGKAGGPHYVLPLMTIKNREVTPEPSDEPEHFQNPAVADAIQAIKACDPSESEFRRLTLFAADADRFATATINQPIDHVQLIGQDNLRRYQPVKQLRIRLTGHESQADLALVVLAAAAAACPITFSLPVASDALEQFLSELDDYLMEHSQSGWHFEWVEETSESLASAISDGRVDRLRLLAREKNLAAEINEACRDAFVTILAEPVINAADIECLRYLLEQSISHDYHRYGNLGHRAAEPRSRPQ